MTKLLLALVSCAFVALPALAQATCTNQVTGINPTIGGPALHVQFVDPANCASPLDPSSLSIVGSPNPSGQVTTTNDLTGISFKCLVGGQFTYTMTTLLGPTPVPPATRPQTTLLVTCGVIPASIVPLQQ